MCGTLGKPLAEDVIMGGKRIREESRLGSQGENNFKKKIEGIIFFRKSDEMRNKMEKRFILIISYITGPASNSISIHPSLECQTLLGHSKVFTSTICNSFDLPTML